MSGIVGVSNSDKPWLFQKGHAPLSTGRPKILNSVRDLARGMAPEALATIQMIMRDEDAPRGTRLQAAGMIMDRAFGRAEQAVAIRESGEKDISMMSTIDLKREFLRSIGQNPDDLDVIEGEIATLENKGEGNE